MHMVALHSGKLVPTCPAHCATRHAEQAECDNLIALQVPAGMPSCPGNPEASRTQISRHHCKQSAAEHQTSALPSLPSCLGLARRGLGILCLGLGGLEPLPHVIRILAIRIVLCLPIVDAARMSKSSCVSPAVPCPCGQGLGAIGRGATAPSAAQMRCMVLASQTGEEQRAGEAERARTRSPASACTGGTRPCWSHARAATHTPHQIHPPWPGLRMWAHTSVQAPLLHEQLHVC